MPLFRTNYVEGIRDTQPVKTERSMFNFSVLVTIVVLATLIVLIILLPTGSEAKTITVDDDGDADYSSIQQAIDANFTFPGDVILVAEGDYHENVIVRKSLTISGIGAENTSIIGNSEGHVVRITSPVVEFSGFHVMGGEEMWFGAGISIESNGNHIFGNNCSGNGVGIFLDNSSNNEINDNTFWGNYQGITLWHYTNLNNVHDNICAFNKEKDGGGGGHGIYMISSANTISANRCFSNEGSGIYIKDATLNTIIGNNCSSNEGYGIRSISSQDMVIANNVCNDNGNYGMYSNQGNLFLIYGNNMKNNRNCAIRIKSSTYFTLYDNGMVGGGILMTGDSTEHWVTHIIPANNTVNGKPVYYYRQSSDISVPGGAGQIIIANCSNIVINGQNMSKSTVGVELAFSSNIIISDTTCSNSLYGMYIYRCENSDPSDSIILTNNSIESNHIGIKIDGDRTHNISVHYNEFVGNTEFGINAADSAESVNATYNWWGHNSGPYHPEENSGGEGDNVSDQVLFDPWVQRIEPMENTNPRIVTEDLTLAIEGDDYSVDYDAIDDQDDDLIWSVGTNASFLTIDLESGVLQGTPEQEDVGTFWVNVTVTDGDLYDFHNFSVVVINVNDPPDVLVLQPGNGEVVNGSIIISGTASDEDSEIVSVELRIDDGAWKQVTGINEWTYELDTTILENGYRIIEVRALDEEHLFNSAAIEVQVENEPEEKDLPDFSVTAEDISIIGSLYMGTNTNVSIFVRNLGGSTGPFILKLYSNSISPTSIISEQYLELDAMSNENVTISWIPRFQGTITIHVVLVDYTGIGELNSQNNHAFQTFFVQEQKDLAGDGSDEDLAVPVPDLVVYVSLGSLVGLLYILRTERGQYLFFSLFILLYTRFSKDKIIEQYNRGRIMGYIETNPHGLYLSDIMKSLHLKNGTAVYHLKMLEKAHYITSKGIGTCRVFYPKKGGHVYGENHPLFERGRYHPSKIQQAIINTIEAHEKITQVDITRILGIGKNALSYHIKKLKKVDIIRVERSGRRSYCSLSYTEE